MEIYRGIQRLARTYGIQPSYVDINGITRVASTESLLAVLKSLGAPVEKSEQAGLALRERIQYLSNRLIEPVIVGWGKEPFEIKVRLPQALFKFSINACFELEKEKSLRLKWQAGDLPVTKSWDFDGSRFYEKSLIVPALPCGYNKLTLEISKETVQAFVISAPKTAFVPGKGEKHIWGVSTPLYSVRSKNNWGAGDFADLANLTRWVSNVGGKAVGTLPLLAAFYGDNYEPSPYLPVSRLFWNEFYLDITGIYEFQNCTPAQALYESMRGDLDNLRQANLVDYKRLMWLKRKILEELCRHVYSHPSNRLNQLLNFIKANPAAEDYARFRAACEKQHTAWGKWEQRTRDGLLAKGDYNESDKQYHLYVQWLASGQMSEVSKLARERNVGLCLDLPLGTHPDGYDVWRVKTIFANRAASGAPPDAFFIAGQNWSFPPLHPEKIRDTHYTYYIRCLRHHFAHASIIRIDHVMGLHRIYWIPEGQGPDKGVYVRYHADELYAILALESQRYKVTVVGEDLGTVKQEVRHEMNQRRFARTYVVNLQLLEKPEVVADVIPGSMASLETFDLFPFAGFWKGQDIIKFGEIGVFNEQKVADERIKRGKIRKTVTKFVKRRYPEKYPKISDIVRVLLNYIAVSPAWLEMINLEDLWLDTQPHNIPGTTSEYPNWRKKHRLSLEELYRSVESINVFDEINKSRESIQ